jgi:integrase
MAHLHQKPNASYSARKRLPVDVREEYGRLYGPRFEAKFFAPASIGRHAAGQRFRIWEAEVAQRIETIRRVQRGEGIDLDRKQAVALAGEWYKWFVARYEEEEAQPIAYEEALWDIIDEMLQFAPEEVRERPLKDMEWARDPEVRTGVRPTIAGRGDTAQFLASRGIVLTPKAQEQFLDCVLDNYLSALNLLARRARGDYGRDELPDTFPEFAPRAQQRTSGLTPEDLFQAWAKARRPAHSTIESWRVVFKALGQRFPHRPAASIKADEAQQWLDELITEDRSAFTVRNTWLRATKTVYAWGAKRKLTGNPFVDVPKRMQLRPKSLYEHEQKAILTAACSVKEISNPDEAARRWVPWLLAYTGARPGEITQLRGRDVQQVDGIWTLNLTPEAGTIKGGHARCVPLHAHLVEQGFVEFAEKHGTAPLFYRPRKQRAESGAEQSKSPAAQARQRLAAWVRNIGVKGKGLSPNHAWRHTFKQIADRAGISEKISDAITGHAPASVARSYGAPTVGDMAEALKKFPRYEVE